MRRQGALAVVATLLLVGIVALGVGLRAYEIRQTYAIGAEDPYTHVVFTREWLEEGAFGDSKHLGTSMYPPGMHAVLGVVASLSGIDVLLLAKWIPLAFAAIAILGTFALAKRLGGVPAALTSAFLVATIPEHVFRTQLLFPTALDLSLFPAWLLLFHELARPSASARWGSPDRWAAAALFLALSIPLAWMHPWAVPLFGIPCLLYAGLRTIRAGGGAKLAARRMALPTLAVALATAFAMASRWNVADTGFSRFLAKMGPLAPLGNVHFPAFVLFLLLLALLLAACAAGVAVVALLASVRPPRRVLGIAGAGLAVGAVVLVYTWPMWHTIPSGVSYRHMLGIPALFLGLAGLGLAFWRPTPLGDMGLALGAVLAPLTAIDVFQSPFWPPRTVAYLSLAAALLSGVAVGALANVSVARVRLPHMRRSLVPIAAVASLLLVAGATVAVPSKNYDWYRLYDDDDYAAFQRLVAKLGEDEDARVFIQTWQPALFVKAMGSPEDVWYSPKFFADPGKRSEQLSQTRGPTYVLVDEFTRKEEARGKAGLSFLSDERVVLQSVDRELVVYQVK